jgi:CSLREA domain-containing protein
MRLFFTVLAVAVIAFSSLRTDAATFLVTKTADTNDGICDADCSLREAVAAANAFPTNDEIRFQGTGEFVLAGTQISVVNNGSLAIVGRGTPLTSISGNDASRILYIAPGASLSVSGITFRRGNGAGVPLTGGGAVTVYSGTLSVDDCSFADNSLPGGGGAMNVFLSTAIVTRSRFDNNRGGSGGAIISQGSSLTIRNTDFANNFATSGGGAVYLASGTGTVENSTFTANSGTAGGALYSVFSVNIQSSIFSGNTARTGDGGAIVVQEGDLTLAGSRVISSNAALSGGGIHSFRGAITNSVIRGNTANGVGGGIVASGAHTITGSVIATNAAESGGGIWGPALTISGSSIEDNAALDVGGGVFGGGSFTNSTISGNRAGGDGGGINTRGFTTLRSVTVANNRGTSGAGVFVIGGSVTAQNSIFADNLTPSSTQEDFWGALNSQGHNLIESTLNTLVSGDTATNIVGLDPALDPLTVTDFPNFHVPRQNSPAIDRGSSGGLTLDQRRLPRPVDLLAVPNAPGGDGADIGAVERQLTEGLGLEGDVTPRLSGDGVVLANDVTVVRQFVLGLLEPDIASGEFQRADSAPLATRGDGRLTAGDVTQVRRFVLGFDPPTPAGGPLAPVSPVPHTEEEGLPDYDSKSDLPW